MMMDELEEKKTKKINDNKRIRTKLNTKNK